MFDELAHLAEALSTLGHVTPRSFDAIAAQGEQLSANKVKGVRAGTPNDLFATRLMREHNDANVISFGARQVAPTLAEAMLDVFLSTPFEGGGRHERRVGKLNAAGGTE